MMKKICMLAVLFLSALTGSLSAQTLDEVKSYLTVGNLKQVATEAVLEKLAEETGLAAVDAYAKATLDALNAAVANGDHLQTLYDNAAKALNEKGDVAALLTEGKALATDVEAEAKSVENAASLAKAAADEVAEQAKKVGSEKNPMKKAKALKALNKAKGVLEQTTKVTPELGKESVNQVQGIAAILKLLL